jgi:hypothetical protein
MSRMSISAEALLDSALKLPSEDRARIAAELIASLDGIPEAGVEAPTSSGQPQGSFLAHL